MDSGRVHRVHEPLEEVVLLGRRQHDGARQADVEGLGSPQVGGQEREDVDVVSLERLLQLAYERGEELVLMRLGVPCAVSVDASQHSIDRNLHST